MYQRLDWSMFRQTHGARPVPASHPALHDRREFTMPERTPVVGDHVRYLCRGEEVSPMSAHGYLLCGEPVHYETYEDPAS